jgi:hypothetical protein
MDLHGVCGNADNVCFVSVLSGFVGTYRRGTPFDVSKQYAPIGEIG